MISSCPFADDEGRVPLRELSHAKEPELDESQEPWGEQPEPQPWDYTDDPPGCIPLLIPAFGMLIIFWLNS